MIPVSLTIKGLYSYQQETTVDFTHLTAAGLFGIFGAVGSGKSTILEAISFALYGETERLNSRDSRSYNMMNLKSNDILIDYIFTCGDCDHKYKFTVTARRNKKKFNDAGTFERKAYIWENAWVPTALNAEKILGLSYDNFKRTIIIPQGKFQEFLQLKEGDRVQMLKEIFGLEKFELSQKVSKLSKDNELKVSNLQGQMQALPMFDEELLQHKESQINELSKNVAEISLNLKNNQENEKNLQDLKALFEDVKAKTVALQFLQNKENTITDLDKQVKEFEKCEQVFKYPLENRNKLQQNLLSQQTEAKKLDADSSIITAAIAVEAKKIDKLKEAYNNRELLLKKAAELEKIVAIKNLEASIETFSDRIKKGEKLVSAEEDKLKIIKNQLLSTKEKIQQAEGALPDTALLVNIHNWFNNRNLLNQNVTKAQQEVAEISAKVTTYKTAIEQQLTQLAEEISYKAFPETFSIVKNKIEEVSKEYDDELQRHKDELTHVKVYQQLDQFAEDLTDGSECPLCGSTHHPQAFSRHNLLEDLQQKETAIRSLEERKTRLNTALVSLATAYSNYENFKLQANQKQAELEKNQTAEQAYFNSFSFAGYTVNDDELVKKQLAEIEEKNAEIKELRSLRDQKDNEVEAADKNILSYKKGVEKLTTEKAQQEGQTNILQAQILLLTLKDELHKKASELTSSAENLKKSYSEITREFEHADKAFHDNSKKLATLQGRIDELQKQIETTTSQLTQVNEQIKILLAKEGFQNELEVQKTLASKIDLKKEKEKVEAFKRELHTATIQLHEAAIKVEGKEYDNEKHLQLQQTIANLAKDLDEKTAKLVTEKHELQELHQQMQNRQALQKDLDKLTLRAENLKVLTNLFRSSGFVNYVSSVYLQNLVNAANQRFHKMTRQKLMLELAEDNSFRVRDFMNNGEVRSAKTLSGGQTFQAALSLALALADNIQHLTKSKQNFFFLDEGFGSLDKEALAIVFKTLKSLRRENRIVGVISHVDEMQQEIQVNLKIVNDPERGSLISNSWSQLNH